MLFSTGDLIQAAVDSSSHTIKWDTSYGEGPKYWFDRHNIIPKGSVCLVVEERMCVGHVNNLTIVLLGGRLLAIEPSWISYAFMNT